MGGSSKDAFFSIGIIGQVLWAIMKTPMAVAGICAAFWDNVIPGTLKERDFQHSSNLFETLLLQKIVYMLKAQPEKKVGLFADIKESKNNFNHKEWDRIEKEEDWVIFCFCIPYFLKIYFKIKEYKFLVF